MAIRLIVKGSEQSSESAGLMSLDVWSGQFRNMASAGESSRGLSVLRAGKISFSLDERNGFHTNLCGGRRFRFFVRHCGRSRMDLAVTAERWRKVGMVAASPWFVQCRLNDPAGIDLTLFRGWPVGGPGIDGTCAGEIAVCKIRRKLELSPHLD